MRSNKLNITTYSAIAVAFLQSSNASAEIQYTDIEPDIFISNPGQLYLLDLNNDGTDDFTFLFTSYNFLYFTYYGGANFYVFNGIFALPEAGNAIAAFTGSGGAYAYPYVIDEGIEIGPYAGNFLTDATQTMVYQFYAIVASYFYYPIYAAGQWIFGETKKYIGLRLQDNDSTYYGWARLDVAFNNKSFIIRDYAIESTPNTPISTFIPVSINSEALNVNNIFTEGNNIHLEINQKSISDLYFNLFDLQGKCIMTQKVVNISTTIIAPPIPAGNYIVQLNSETTSYSKQVYLPGK